MTNLSDPRSAQGIAARGKTVYQGGSPNPTGVNGIAADQDTAARVALLAKMFPGDGGGVDASYQLGPRPNNVTVMGPVKSPVMTPPTTTSPVANPMAGVGMPGPASPVESGVAAPPISPEVLRNALMRRMRRGTKRTAN